MTEAAMRVAILGRAGPARDQLHRALLELGADIVAEGDPAELKPDAVAGYRPEVVLVSLEPALEDALESYDTLLADPALAVVYDDAEVTRALEGWDLARWARHLAAKLLGRDVLPPPPAGADLLPRHDLSPVPGAPPTPAELMANERLEDYTIATGAYAEVVPSSPSLGSGDGGAETPVGSDHARLAIELGDIEQALERAADTTAEPTAPPEVTEATDAGFSLDIDLGGLDQMLDEDRAAAKPADPVGPTLADFEFDPDRPVNFALLAGGQEETTEPVLDADLKKLAAELDRQTSGFQPYQRNDAAAAAAEPAAAPASAAPTPGFGLLELAPMDDEPAHPASRAEAPKASFGAGAGLRLEPMAEAAASITAAAGAIAVIAGLGGPDAVRQFLGALPPALPVPVLLWQHLDAGRHDRLATQLGKASRLPVYLAEAGAVARPGAVAVLPAGLGVSRTADGALQFVPAEGGAAALVAALAGTDYVAVLLSGADPASVEPAAALAAQGGLALAQDPAACFDPAAASALQARGAEVATPTELAAHASARWRA